LPHALVVARHATPPASIASRLTNRDDAFAPLAEAGRGGSYALIYEKRKKNIFSAAGWTNATFFGFA
jgi:hypothetical protein